MTIRQRAFKCSDEQYELFGSCAIDSELPFNSWAVNALEKAAKVKKPSLNMTAEDARYIIDRLKQLRSIENVVNDGSGGISRSNTIQWLSRYEKKLNEFESS